MKRNVDLNEITDGRFYGINDMVKAGCNNCEGCSKCCHGMGNSVVLDPYDIYRLTTGLNMTFSELMKDKISLGMVDGIIMPSLLTNKDNDACVFLNGQGRCSVYNERPSVCRIFPLGRYYENGTFRYILQVNECVKKDHTKVKVKEWIAAGDIKENEKFLNDWHYFVSGLEAGNKDVIMKVLNIFYTAPYDLNRGFYEQYYERKEQFLCCAKT